MSDTELTPYEAAKQIADHPTDGSYGDGRRIIGILLDGRDPDDLNLDELRLAFKGYNWWGELDLSFEAARRALGLDPTSPERHREAAIAIRNCTASGRGESPYASQAVLSLFDRMIQDRIGSAAYWHVQKAIEFYDLATQHPEYEDYIDWREGDPIYRPDALEGACRELGLAVRLDPRIREENRWMRGGGCSEEPWDRLFLALQSIPEYQRLMQR